jgi:uncharacterized membrane protein
VLPGISALFALIVGWLLSQIRIGPNSWLQPILFQGTADDARTLLIDITSTVVTVIALVLGLTVVALQLSSTQYSPRLLRGFIRDRPNQIALSIFTATFAYCAAGLYTVGVAAGNRVETYPRLAVSFALVLLFATLATVVFFADHLVNSIQIDTMTGRVERETLRLVGDWLGFADEPSAQPPSWAVPVPAQRSGYVQWARPADILPALGPLGLIVRVVPRVGEHVVAGLPIAWAWREDEAPGPVDVAPITKALPAAVRVGSERTQEQDVAFGIRQLVDVACKALSPAVNDPYTAVQAIDHLTIIFCAMVTRPLGDQVMHRSDGRGTVIIPGRRFRDYLAQMCGLIRRYGAAEPTVMIALLRLLTRCGQLADRDRRREAIRTQAGLIVQAATRVVVEPADLETVRLAAERVELAIRGDLRAG